MRFNISDPVVYNRLRTAIETSYRGSYQFRKIFESFVKEYAGPKYAEGTNTKTQTQYLNMMQQAIETWMITTIPNMPQVQISTSHQSLEPFSKHFQTAVNNLLKEIQFEETARKWLLYALFGMGVLKIHLSDSGQVELEGDVAMDPGIPFASVLGIDDFVFDMSAKELRECKWMGDMYRISYDEMLETDFYDRDQILKMGLVPTSKTAQVAPERAENVSRGYAVDGDEFEPMIDLADIYIPSVRKIYTYAVEDRTKFTIKGPHIAEMDWDGSELGPYKILSMIDVPENIMPGSLAEQLSAMSRMINNLMRKQARQAYRQKELTFYGASEADNIRRIQAANDGDTVNVNDPKEIAVVKYGGPNQENQMFMGNVIDLFDRMGGNISAMAGLGPQAGTAKQGRDHLGKRIEERNLDAAKNDQQVEGSDSRLGIDVVARQIQDDYRNNAGSRFGALSSRRELVPG